MNLPALPPTQPRERRAEPRDPFNDMTPVDVLLAEAAARRERVQADLIADACGETRREACRQYRQNQCRKALWEMRKADHAAGVRIPIQLPRVPQ